MLLSYSSDVGCLVEEIVSREPLVKHRSEQLGKLISSELVVFTLQYSPTVMSVQS